MPRRAVVLLVWGLLGAATSAEVVLDESCTWRRYLCFAVSRYSPAALKAEGQRLAGSRKLVQLQRRTEAWLKQQGADLRGADWRDHAVEAMMGARAFNPSPTPAPPADWAAADFDDGQWVRRRRPFQGTPAAAVKLPGLGQYGGDVDLRLRAACYRGRFVVDDPAAAGAVTVRVVYRGGARVLVNGQELARGHLPPGALAEDTPGSDYPPAAYPDAGAQQRDRVLGPVAVPARLLRKGVNVLAIEVRASFFHPIVLANPIQANWGGPQRPFPHARLSKVELRASGAGVRSSTRRPAGVHAWAVDMHDRVQSTDFPPPAEPPGTLALVGAANGTYAAQLAVATDRPLTGLRAEASDLAGVGGTGSLPAAAVRCLSMVPFPADRWTPEHLGDERGLEAAFPTQGELAAWASMPDRGTTYLFDRLGGAGGVALPAGACRPIWLSMRIPPDAAPGRYRGIVRVLADGLAAIPIPVELEVVAWRLPDPAAFQTLVGCEQDPYGLAAQYGVAPWTDEHFALLAASFRQLGRIGNTWLNVPVLARTEFGNGDDSMVRWVRRRDGGLAFDYAVMDRYLDLAAKHCGRPRVIQFTVMHGMRSAADPPAPPQVTVHDEATGRAVPMPVGLAKGGGGPARAAWGAFAQSLLAHMKARGLAGSVTWGYPLEQEAEPDLKNVLAAAAPGVGWIAGPHEMMANGTYAKNERFYRIVADIRYHGGWASFRDDRGWKSRAIHLLNPRAGGTVLALHTTSLPWPFRLMPQRALAMGRNGFTRVGADGWAGMHYRGMAIPRWLTGMPVLSVLWPGPRGAEPGARFEALLEGIQQAESRIFLEQALDAGRAPGALAARARHVLDADLRETDFLLGNSLLPTLEACHYRWQQRSAALYRLAAEVAAAGRP